MSKVRAKAKAKAKARAKDREITHGAKAISALSRAAKFVIANLGRANCCLEMSRAGARALQSVGINARVIACSTLLMDRRDMTSCGLIGHTPESALEAVKKSKIFDTSKYEGFTHENVPELQSHYAILVTQFEREVIVDLTISQLRTHMRTPDDVLISSVDFDGGEVAVNIDDEQQFIVLCNKFAGEQEPHALAYLQGETSALDRFVRSVVQAACDGQQTMMVLLPPNEVGQNQGV